MTTNTSRLWKHPAFLKLWFGQTVSLFGSQITAFSIPLIAALLLDASPFEMGLLQAMSFAPVLLFSLFVGVWVDRKRRLPILISTDIGRFLLLACIPILAWMDWLSIPLLCLLVFLVGVLTVFFDVAYVSFLPTLVERDDLIEGNSKLELSRSVSSVTGPGLAGLLVQMFSAPIAIAVDALSFLLSAFALLFIRVKEEIPQTKKERPNMWREIREGVVIVFQDPVLRLLAVSSSLLNVFTTMTAPVLILFITRDLQLSVAQMGLIFAMSGLGAFLGATFAKKVFHRVGLGYTLIGSLLLGSAAALMIPLVVGPSLTTILVLIASQVLGGIGMTLYRINQVSLRMAVTPTHLQGRVNGTLRFLMYGLIPVASLLGGLLGQTIGLRATLFIGAAGMWLIFFLVLLSPLRRMSETPNSNTFQA